jgi:hypothetical protein
MVKGIILKTELTHLDKPLLKPQRKEIIPKTERFPRESTKK